jgi:NitT/TauT family transport system permease protein
MSGQRLFYNSAPWLATIFLFLLWEIICREFSIPDFILPKPSSILETALRFKQPILQHSLHTLMTTLIGFALAIVGGLLLGLMIGASPLVYRALYPLLIGFNTVPKVAVVPILVIWFGVGTIPAIITAFAISFFPIVVNVATGLATIEPELRDVLRSVGASKTQILTKIGIPRSLPYLFASFKIAITLAFIGSIVSETVASNEGIGYLMLAASSRFDVPLAFAGLLAVAAMGIVLYAISSAFERRMTRWAFRGSDLVA